MPATTSTPAALRRAYVGAPRAGLYDPAVASDGLTLDTALGPVDLVAIERALSGRPVDLTAAEVAYLFASLPATRAAAVPVAAALELSEDTVRSRARAITGRKVA